MRQHEGDDLAECQREGSILLDDLIPPIQVGPRLNDLEAIVSVARRRNHPALSCLVRQSSDHDVLKLYVPRMALQPDVALSQARVVGRDRIVRHQLTVERHFDRSVGGLDFKGIPLASGFGSDRRGRCKAIDGTRLV